MPEQPQPPTPQPPTPPAAPPEFEIPNIPEILKAVTTPLIFFALALIVVEVALAYVVTNVHLTEPGTMIVVSYMAGLPLVICLFVFYLTVKLPQNLKTTLEETARKLRAG